MSDTCYLNLSEEAPYNFWLRIKIIILFILNSVDLVRVAWAIPGVHAILKRLF